MQYTQTDKSYGRANKRVQTQNVGEHEDGRNSPSKDGNYNSQAPSLDHSMTSRNSNSTDMPDKQTTAASPRLHQLVRVGPDGRPEIVGRIGITKSNALKLLNSMKYKNWTKLIQRH